MNWNVTVSQALPWRSVLKYPMSPTKARTNGSTEVMARSGTKTTYPPAVLLLAGSHRFGHRRRDLRDAHVPQRAGLHQQHSNNNQPLACAGPYGANYKLTFNANDWRPLNVYQDVYLLYHGSYANYNSLQVSWQKQSGPVTFLTNYTFSKVLGITRWTDRQRTGKWYRRRSVQHPEQLWSSGLRPHAHSELLVRVEHAEVHSRQPSSAAR